MNYVDFNELLSAAFNFSTSCCYNLKSKMYSLRRFNFTAYLFFGSNTKLVIPKIIQIRLAFKWSNILILFLLLMIVISQPITQLFGTNTKLIIPKIFQNLVCLKCSNILDCFSSWCSFLSRAHHTKNISKPSLTKIIKYLK